MVKEHFYKILISLFICLFLFGCNTAKKKYYKVISYKPRVSTTGFTIEPPSGKGWYETVKGDSLIYLKKTDPYKYSLQTKATEISVPSNLLLIDDIVRFVNSRVEKKFMVHHKNKSLKYIVDDNKKSLCVRYEYLYEDHDKINVKDIGLVCIHPDVPINGIELSYMEKTLPNVPCKTYLNEAEQFLKGLHIGELIKN